MYKFVSLPDSSIAFHAAWRGDVDNDLDACETTLQSCFAETRPWGMDTAIDLRACCPTFIRDASYIRRFVIDLCETIRMRRYGEPQIVHFGQEERVAGYTLVQLIETSDIVAHFINQQNAACLNVFSCSFYSPITCARLCQQWFAAQDVRLSVVLRGQWHDQLPAPCGKSVERT
jgi:S-adenosylmethionine/arginine decarboxylase-like enzyme